MVFPNETRFRKRLNECIELAEKYGLSAMTMEEISEEVKVARKNAKNSKCNREIISNLPREKA